MSHYLRRHLHYLHQVHHVETLPDPASRSNNNRGGLDLSSLISGIQIKVFGPTIWINHIIHTCCIIEEIERNE